MFTGPVGPVEILFLLARSRFWEFLLLVILSQSFIISIRFFKRLLKDISCLPFAIDVLWKHRFLFQANLHNSINSQDHK